MIETKEKKDGNDKVLALLFSEEKKSGYCDTLGFIHCMQKNCYQGLPNHNSNTVQSIGTKLGTHAATDNMPMYGEEHNSGLYNYRVMTLFQHRFWYLY